MSKAQSAVRVGAMLMRSGLLRPGSPMKVGGQLAALKRWGTTLGGSFASAAARDPEQVALIDHRGQLTYAEMDARTSALAASLRRDDRAVRGAVLCRNHRGMVETLIACSKAGADAILLNTGMSLEQLLAVLEQQQADVLVADPEFTAVTNAAPRSVKVLSSETDLERLMDKGATDLEPPRQPGRTIVLSSGTSGPPKGAHRKASPGITPLASILSRIPLRVHDRMLIEAPLFHTWGYAALQLAVSLRATIMLRPRFEPEACLRWLEWTKSNVLIAVPVMLQRVLEVPDRHTYDTSALRIAAVSGSALPGGLATAFMDGFGNVLYNLYGSTETSWVTIATPEDLRTEPDTAGTPPPGTRLAILDPFGEPLPPGKRGRIFAENELLFAGYTNGASKETFDGMMSLGDIGHIDTNGRLFVHGRDDDMFVSGGENVFPGEIEELLLRLPQVSEAAVVGVPDARFGQRAAAFIVLKTGLTLTDEHVRDHARRHAAKYAVPRDVYFVEELPRNATGKVVRRKLIKP